MALAQATLAEELTKLFDSSDPNFVGYPANLGAAASNWGNAYNTYASTAVDVSGDSLVSANAASFVSALQSGLESSSDATAAANAFDAAFVAYWTGAVFSIGFSPTPASACPSVGGTGLWSSEISSVVSAVTASTLTNLLVTEFAILGGSAASKADSLATAFHSATTTAVFVLITGLDTTPTPAGPLPITNTCTIF